jgi:hypothetical protein
MKKRNFEAQGLSKANMASANSRAPLCRLQYRKYFGEVLRNFGEKKCFRPKKYDEIRRFDGVSEEYANLFQTVCIKVTDENQKHFLTVIDINLSICLCSSRYMAIAARSPGPCIFHKMDVKMRNISL